MLEKSEGCGSVWGDGGGNGGNRCWGGNNIMGSVSTC